MKADNHREKKAKSLWQFAKDFFFLNYKVWRDLYLRQKCYAAEQEEMACAVPRAVGHPRMKVNRELFDRCVIILFR